MTDDDRVQDALAEYLEHLEMGGAAPDFSHLADDERRALQELIDTLELTGGIASGRGAEHSPVVEAATPEGERLVAELRAVLPPGTRLDADDNRLVTRVGRVAVVERFVIGTFGGRVRVWLTDADTVRDVEDDADALDDLERVFRMFPDMAAVALVARDLSAVVVEPEDTGPQIRVPSGSLVSRRYRRAVEPAAAALSRFLDELVPYWDPMPAFDRDSGIRIDIAEIAGVHVPAAVEHRRAVGERARKGNPKKDALTRFGDVEARGVAELVAGLFDGSIEPDDVEARIERMTDR